MKMESREQLVGQEQPPLILVVDDDAIMRSLIVQAVAKEGYRVVEAENGAECLAQYREHAPDLVLLDAVMPVMDGFSCCAELQKIKIDAKRTSSHTVDFPSGEDASAESEDDSKHYDKIPVLIITGLEDDESVDNAFNAGAIDYVTKPIHWKVLRRRVNRIIEQSQMHRNLERANAELNRLASTDSLTQIANRKRFDEYFAAQWNLMQRLDREISVILCDIDYFKQYNDTYGHQAGDRCLKVVATAIAKQVRRPSDVVARYGGEEFALILPNTPSKDAANIAHNICKRIETLELNHEGSESSDYVTLSIGVAGMLPDVTKSYHDLINLADKALYEAKSKGKNRVYLAYDEHEDGLLISNS